jgi:hypothetical protein
LLFRGDNFRHPPQFIAATATYSELWSLDLSRDRSVGAATSGELLRSLPNNGSQASHGMAICTFILSLAPPGYAWMDWGIEGSFYAAETTARDLDDASGTGADDNHPSRCTTYCDQASYWAAELGLKASGK